MRRAARTDANQQRIVEVLRGVGATVHPTHQLGAGFPDLVVGFRGVNYLLEVKDGNKPPSKQALTDDEAEFITGWLGQVHIVNSDESALRAIGAID